MKTFLWLGLLFLLPIKKQNSTPTVKKKASAKAPTKEPETFEGILLGDSQSVGPASPGRRLASLFTKAGRPCRVLAKGGKTAAYFLKGPGRLALDALLKKKPAWVIVFLGSNELANIAAFPLKSGRLNPKLVNAQVRPHEKLAELLRAAGVEVFFVGPPNFGEKVRSESGGLPLNTAAPEWLPHIQSIYGEGFLDARPLTPEHKGVHFFGKGEAEAFAAELFPAVAAMLPEKAGAWWDLNATKAGDLYVFKNPSQRQLRKMQGHRLGFLFTKTAAYFWDIPATKFHGADVIDAVLDAWYTVKKKLNEDVMKPTANPETHDWIMGLCSVKLAHKPIVSDTGYTIYQDIPEITFYSAWGTQEGYTHLIEEKDTADYTGSQYLKQFYFVDAPAPQQMRDIINKLSARAIEEGKAADVLTYREGGAAFNFDKIAISDAAAKIAELMSYGGSLGWPAWLGIGIVLGLGVAAFIVGPEAFLAFLLRGAMTASEAELAATGAADVIVTAAEGRAVKTVSVAALEALVPSVEQALTAAEFNAMKAAYIEAIVSKLGARGFEVVDDVVEVVVKAAR